MKQSEITSVDALVNALEIQRKSRKDIIADTTHMSFSHLDGISKLSVKSEGFSEEYTLTNVAKHQLAQRLQIPWYYYTRMEEMVPDLLVANVNRWLKHNREPRLLRTMDGRIRAFLSHQYRRIENLEVLEHVLEAANSRDDMEPMSMAVTENYMYVKFVCKSFEAEVNVGDIVKCGFSVVNSEIGLSSLQVHSLIFRLVCSNGLVVAEHGNGYRQVHRGLIRTLRAHPYELTEGISQKDKETFATIGPLVKKALDQNIFTNCVDALITAKNVPFKNKSDELIQTIGEQYRLTMNERDLVLKHYLIARDYSVFGLVQATTRASQDLDDYGRASDLETIGGSILRDYVHPSKYMPAYQLVA